MDNKAEEFKHWKKTEIEINGILECIIKTIAHQSEERGFGHVERESHFALMILIDNTKNDTKMHFQWHLFYSKLQTGAWDFVTLQV